MHCLVVDDDQLPRGGTVVALQRVRPGIVVSEASCLNEAFQILDTLADVELVVLDLNLGSTMGIHTLKLMRTWCVEKHLCPRIVVVSGAGIDNTSLLLEVLDTHATGFILKNTPKAIFEHALRLTLDGGIYIPAEILRELKLPRPHQLPTTSGLRVSNPSALTPREREIAKFLVKGWSYKKIANSLVGVDGKMLAEETVRRHVGNIAAKFNVGNGIQPRSGVMAQLAKIGTDML